MKRLSEYVVTVSRRMSGNSYACKMCVDSENA